MYTTQEFIFSPLLGFPQWGLSFVCPHLHLLYLLQGLGESHAVASVCSITGAWSKEKTKSWMNYTMCPIFGIGIEETMTQMYLQFGEKYEK